MRIYLVIALMLVFYAFPWVVNPAASLSPNAYDLAEWTSLHPAVRAETPMLLTSLLLRLPLACLALLIAFRARRNWFSVIVVLLIGLALLPPLEFIKTLGDPNYDQQAALAAITLIGGAIGLSGILPRARRWIAAGIALVGASGERDRLASGLQPDARLPTPDANRAGRGGAGADLRDCERVSRRKSSYDRRGQTNSCLKQTG